MTLPWGSALILMLFNSKNAVSVFNNLKEESDVISHARLPDASCLIIFLSAKRWMSDIRKEETQLLLERSFYLL